MNLKTNKKISMRPIFTIITHSSYGSSSPAMRDNATGGRALVVPAMRDNATGGRAAVLLMCVYY